MFLESLMGHLVLITDQSKTAYPRHTVIVESMPALVVILSLASAFRSLLATEFGKKNAHHKLLRSLTSGDSRKNQERHMAASSSLMEPCHEGDYSRVPNEAHCTF